MIVCSNCCSRGARCARTRNCRSRTCGTCIRPYEPVVPLSSVQSRLLTRLAGQSLFESGWVEHRVNRILETGQQAPVERWAWKEPNTHIVADLILQLSEHVKYIHVVRNGLDMAWSRNQNQLKFWGPLLLGDSVQRKRAERLSRLLGHGAPPDVDDSGTLSGSGAVRRIRAAMRKQNRNADHACRLRFRIRQSTDAGQDRGRHTDTADAQ